MRLCPRGHDKDVVGVDRGSHCSECRREQNRIKERARRKRGGKRKTPRSTCQNGLHPKTGPGPCAECAKAKRARYKSRLEERDLPPSKRAKPVFAPPPDGLEAEYGPVPPPEPKHEHFDWVVVYRLLNGIPVGRTPTVPEWDEFFAQQKSTTYLEVLHASGVSPTTVNRHAQRNGYTFPYELCAHARSRTRTS